MEKVKKILMISTITVVFAIMPVFGAKKQGVTIYKQSDLVKQQVNIYTPAAYQSGNVVRSGLGIKGDVIELVVDYSGSMDSWIKLAISTLRGILPKISPETNVGLRVFGQDTGQPFISVMFNSCKATEQVVRPAQKNSASVINGLNKTKIGYATPLTYALKRTVYGDFAGIEIDVVVEIGKMPVQRRRVGENAQLIFVENAFLVYYLKYNLTSALLCESPVYCGCARVDRVYLDTAHGFLYFIHCGTCPEDI